MKRFWIALLLLLLVPMCVHAEDRYDEYISTYDFSFFEDALDKDTYSVLDDLGLTGIDYNRLSNISLDDVKDISIEFSKGKIKTPIESGILILAYVVLSSFFQSFKIGEAESLSDVYSTASALVIASVLLVKIGQTITLSAASLSVASNFVYAFVPSFGAIVASSGGVTTAFSTNALLLVLSEGLSFVSSNVFVPVINCFLAISICSSINSQLNLDRLVTLMRKGITSAISFLSACFVSILSIKTAVASKADAIGLRSIRFAINSVVPVIGSAISEGLLSIQTYSSLIKSSIGIVGIIAVALVFLPAIIEVVFWRIALSACELVSAVFGDNSVSQTLKSFKEAMLLINVVLILSMVTTIISIGILIAARNG